MKIKNGLSWPHLRVVRVQCWVWMGPRRAFPSQIVGVAEGGNILCPLFLVAPLCRVGRLWGRFAGVRVLPRFVVALLLGLAVLVGLPLFWGEGSGCVALNAG
ncbi:hypothetical protein, partial [Streptomyces sp. NPDC056820]|uniref:hypothetical protein n=1 Tax=Streptomyces sp. NPDC056820 TaxID=3345951 RepID=UPI0036766E54